MGRTTPSEPGSRIHVDLAGPRNNSSQVLAADQGSRREWVYEMVPSQPLPIVDLSQSLKSKYLHGRVLAAVDHVLVKYNRLIVLSYMVALCCSFCVPLIDTETGKFLGILAGLLCLPLGLGSVGTLRYDVVRLLMGTYDFWFFLIVNTSTNVIVALVFRDLRAARLLLDWTGFQNIVMIDSQLRGIRQLAKLVVVGIPTVLMLLVCIVLRRVDDVNNFTIVEYEIKQHRYHLEATDVIANGLVTISILLSTIVYRKRRLLKPRAKTDTIECAIYRCSLQLSERYTFPALEAIAQPIPVAAIAPSSPPPPQPPQAQATKVGTHGPEFVQRMVFVKSNRVFHASRTVLPLDSGLVPRLPILAAVALYLIGAAGLFFACIGFMDGFDAHVLHERSDVCELRGWIALGCTAAFTLTFGALYQRQLLRLLFTSFDFVFYSIQLTAVHISICVLHRWSTTSIAIVWSLWIWIHWAMTLDALTPRMRKILRFHIHLVTVVVVVFVISQCATVYHVLVHTGTSMNDQVLWRAMVWGSQVEVRIIPFFVSRVVTLVPWTLRLLFRVAKASNSDLIVLRGTVTYPNCFAGMGGKPRKSRLAMWKSQRFGHVSPRRVSMLVAEKIGVARQAIAPDRRPTRG